jgi:hypothetical protein
MLLSSLFVLHGLFWLGFIATGPIATRKRRRFLAEVVVLKQEFEHRVPDGWMFFDGEGRF